MVSTSLLARCALASAIALLAGCASTAPTCAPSRLAYVGTDGGQLLALRLDACAGTLSSLGTAATLTKPRWAVANPARPILYVADDIAGQDGHVVAFAVNRDSGALATIGVADAGGIGTTHLWLDAPSSTLLAANFFSGSATSLPLTADGNVGAVASTVKETGSGPTRRQTKAHAHGITLDPSGRYALVSDLGADRVFVDDFDRATHALAQGDAATAEPLAVAPGSGPHHAVFAPDGHVVYLLDELSADVQVLRWHARDARLAPLQPLPISSADFKGARSGAEIATSRDGRFVYVADRGEGTLVVFRANAETGELTFMQRVPSGGDKPWGFAIDPSGQWMLVANAAKVSLLRIDAATGALSDSGRAVDVATPLSVAFMP